MKSMTKLEFLNMVADAVLNADMVESMQFWLKEPEKPPFIGWYGNPPNDLGLVITKDLIRLDKASADLSEGMATNSPPSSKS